MTENQIYDVIVIGAGPGGYVCAIRTAQLGLKTALVEKKWLGGVCLNVGCIPTKALLKNAELAYTLRVRAHEFGVSFDNLKLDYNVAVKRSRKISKRLTTGIKTLMRNNNVDVYMDTAQLIAKDTLQLTDADGNVRALKARNIVLATGVHTLVPPGWEVDGEHILTYADAILQERLPESVVIIGAGAIGMEFASLWSSYGTQVTIVEMQPNILPLEDEEISAELEKTFKRRGVKILTNYRVQSLEKTASGARVVVESGEEEKTLEAEQVLISIGNVPNTADIGLNKAGVELTERGFIMIDERMETNVPGIWAIGDVSGKMLLAHVASAQGVVCAENIAGVETVTLDYRMMPSAVYCHPQVASFGFTEAQALDKGHKVVVGRYPYMANGKALGLGEGTGFAKIISDVQSGEILGAHMVGPYVSESLPELTLAQQMKLTAEEIARNVHAHPTLSEVIMEAAHFAGTPKAK
jgi:dihydrolipoamide dehydrogenase